MRTFARSAAVAGFVVDVVAAGLGRVVEVETTGLVGGIGLVLVAFDDDPLPHAARARMLTTTTTRGKELRTRAGYEPTRADTGRPGCRPV
jgi:hypothetical protein